MSQPTALSSMGRVVGFVERLGLVIANERGHPASDSSVLCTTLGWRAHACDEAVAAVEVAAAVDTTYRTAVYR